MNTLTIPKKLTKKGDLVVIPRREYEDLLELKKIKEFTLTGAQKRALARAEKNLSNNKILSYHELLRELGAAH